MKPSKLTQHQLVIKFANKLQTTKHPVMLTFEEVEAMFENTDVCSYTKKEFTSIGDITFERINPSLPYTKSNVVLVKSDINQLKGTLLDKFIHEAPMSKRMMGNLFVRIGRHLLKEAEKQEKEIPVKKPQPTALEYFSASTKGRSGDTTRS